MLDFNSHDIIQIVPSMAAIFGGITLVLILCALGSASTSLKGIVAYLLGVALFGYVTYVTPAEGATDHLLAIPHHRCFRTAGL